MTLRGALLCVGLAVGVALSPASAGAQSRASALDNDLSLVATEVAGLEQRFGALRGEVAGGSLTRSPRLISERFNEARYAFLVEDFERCSLLFYSLIENEDLKGDLREPDAEWNLAECLFLDGNLIPAQVQFRRIVDKGATHAHYPDALLKLIEIYGRTGDVQQFNSYYNTFVRSSQDGSPTSLRIRYGMGKTLFFQGKLPEAQAIFAAFPRGSTYTPQAHYFSGAILVAEGRAAANVGDADLAMQKYGQALEVFLGTLELPRSTAEHRDVLDLSNLALARLHYERGEVPKAVSAYAAVQSDSRFYADGLYELIWVNIESATQEEIELERTRRYEEALRAIDIFNLAFPNDVREPALRLLAAHVRVKMARFEEAITLYGEASEHFADLKQVVTKIVESGADPMVYFNQLVEGDRFIAEADLTVPAAARRKAREDKKVSEAVRIAGDLYRQQEDIGDADDLLDVLERALSEGSSQDLLQTYRIHRQQIGGSESSAVLLRSRLIDLETEWLRQDLPAASRSALEQAVGERGAGSAAARGMAADRQARLGRLESFDLQAQAVGTRLFQLDQLIKEMGARLGAVEEYLVGARARGERSREQETEARATIDAERRELAAALVQTRNLRKRLAPRLLTGRLVASSGGDEGARGDAVGAALDAAESRLTELRRGAPASDFPRRIDDLRGRLRALATQSGELRARLDEAERGEVTSIKREINFQRMMVDGLETEGDTIGVDNQGVSGRIGARAFRDVAAFYEDMLTRADMGVADVYWYRKESLSQEKRTLARDRTERLRILEDAFRDVLESVE